MLITNMLLNSRSYTVFFALLANLVSRASRKIIFAGKIKFNGKRVHDVRPWPAKQHHSAWDFSHEDIKTLTNSFLCSRYNISSRELTLCVLNTSLCKITFPPYCSNISNYWTVVGIGLWLYNHNTYLKIILVVAMVVLVVTL